MPEETPPQIPQQDPYAAWQAHNDAQQLDLIALLSVIYGVLAFLCGSMFLIHIFMGASMAINPGAFFPQTKGSPAPAPPPLFGIMMSAMGLAALLLAWFSGGLSLYASKCIRERRNWGWIIGSAGVNCLNMPLGTALGVFTIIVLHRPSVQAAFGRQLPPPYSPPPRL